MENHDKLWNGHTEDGRIKLTALVVMALHGALPSLEDTQRDNALNARPQGECAAVSQGEGLR